MKELTLLTWPDYINPQTLDDFQKETGIHVKLDIVPSAVELVERMKSDSASIDLLVPPDYAVRELGSLNLLTRLDHSQLPNMVHLYKRFQIGRPHDPDSEISMIKDWGTTGFMYRTDVVIESPVSWVDFWSLAEKYSGKVTVLDSPGEVIGAALKMLGHSYNSSSKGPLDAARIELLKLKSHLFAFDTNYKPLMSTGLSCLSLGWNGDAAVLKSQGVPVVYVLPTEGSQIWEDDWAVSVNSPNQMEAHLFLNYVLRPEVAAKEAEYTRYATGNESAIALLPDEIRSDSSTYPPNELMEKLEAGLPLGDDGQARRELLWTEIRK